jgi:peptidoglycan/LPS O-acetylase OafA/YrhL
MSFYGNLPRSVLTDNTSGDRKFLSLEAFRGLAALMVVLYHSRFYGQTSAVSFVSNSFLFVDFFFLLSGFVMAHSYLERIGRDITLRKFVLLRFGRLYPLHLFTLLLWVPYVAVKVLLHHCGIGDTDPSESNNTFTFLSNVFLVQSFDGYYPLSWNFPSWSISAEFYTYVLFFIFIYATLKLFSARGVRTAGVLALSLGGYAMAWLVEDQGIEVFLFQCIGGFFAGILIFLVYQRVRPSPLRYGAATAVELLTVVFMIWCVTNNHGQGFRGNSFFYLCIVSFVAVIYCFVVQRGWLSGLLSRPLFQFIGKLSYSIYMLHAIVLAMTENLFVYVLKFHKTSFEGAANVIVFKAANVVNVALIVVVIVVSALTYRFVELPWRTRFKRFAADNRDLVEKSPS